MSENPPPNGRTSAFFGSLRNAVGFGRPKTLLPPIKSNKSSSEQPAPADNGDTVFRAGTPLKKRESFKLLLGAIQDVASLADEQLGNIDNNDHDQGNKSSCPQDISATKMTLFKQVSKLKNGNERILGGLDNILTMVEDGDKLKKSPSTQSEKKLDSMRRDMHHTMEEILKAREEELRKAFDAKLEAAVRLSLEFAQSEIHKAEEKHEKEMEIVKQESLDRERTVQLSAAQQAHDRIAGLTKMLVQNISHEIRSPLNVISAGLHIVEDQLMMSSVNGSVDVDDLIEIIKEIKQSCTECSVVLDDIVLYESIKNGGIKINSEIIHVFGLVRQVVRDFLLQAKLCNITIIYEDISSSAQDRGPTVLADKEKFIHVIRRMLSDAIRYTPSEGTVTIRVRWMPISSSTSHICYHGCIRIDFEDSGGGFSKEASQLLFSCGDEPGEQLDMSISTQGAGLRMWICKEIMSLLGGGVGVETDRPAGAGALFFIEIPLVRSSYKPPELNELRAISAQSLDGFGDIVNSALSLSGIPPIRIARNKGVLKVLVVDDVATCRKMHVRLIEDHCKACYQASDGLQCLLLVEESLARCDPFDVILLDSEMPNMTGPEASIALRNMGFKGKIIGITGNARDRDIEDFLHAGADKIILKPLKAEAILELMLELKDNRVARWVMTKMARRSSVTSSFSSGIFTNLTSTDSQDHTVAN